MAALDELVKGLCDALKPAIAAKLARSWPGSVVPQTGAEVLAKRLALSAQKELRYTKEEAVWVYLGALAAIQAAPVQAREVEQIA